MKIIDLINKIINLPTKKKVILYSSIILVILILVLSFIIILRNKETNATSLENKEMLMPSIPNVTLDNTKINISSLEETENVTITVEEKLDDYDLYYFIENPLAEYNEEIEENIV
jgi:hypothetical protein